MSQFPVNGGPPPATPSQTNVNPFSKSASTAQYQNTASYSQPYASVSNTPSYPADSTTTQAPFANYPPSSTPTPTFTPNSGNLFRYLQSVHTNQIAPPFEVFSIIIIIIFLRQKYFAWCFLKSSSDCNSYWIYAINTQCNTSTTYVFFANKIKSSASSVTSPTPTPPVQYTPLQSIHSGSGSGKQNSKFFEVFIL